MDVDERTRSFADATAVFLRVQADGMNMPMGTSTFDFTQTDQDDLTTGKSPWGQGGSAPSRRSLTESMKADIAIVGGGITGALIADHLMSLGRNVVLIDRDPMGHGSTQASTAMLQWETDATLVELTQAYGFDAAARVYRLSLAAINGLVERITLGSIQCQLQLRPTLYLSSDMTGEAALAEELALRHRAGLPGWIVRRPDLLAEFGFDREAAIVSPGSAEADPLLLSWALIENAYRNGAKLISAEARHFHEEGGKVVIETDCPFVVEANAVVLATGYVMPHFVMPECHTIVSSFAICTGQQRDDALWRNRALVWEAADPYHYMRTTADNRIIIGGEDTDVSDPSERDKMLPAKAALLQTKLRELVPSADCKISRAWCGAFGETADGLPLIGPVPNTKHVYAAYGYGGNGITFSYLASRMIGTMMSGARQPWNDLFALNRTVRTIL